MPSLPSPRPPLSPTMAWTAAIILTVALAAVSSSFAVFQAARAATVADVLAAVLLLTVARSDWWLAALFLAVTTLGERSNLLLPNAPSLSHSSIVAISIHIFVATLVNWLR